MTIEKTGWLIEGAGVYWCGRNIHDFRPAWDDAVYFATREDAERVLYWIFPEEYRRTCRAAEHLILPDGAHSSVKSDR